MRSQRARFSGAVAELLVFPVVPGGPRVSHELVGQRGWRSGTGLANLSARTSPRASHVTTSLTGHWQQALIVDSHCLMVRPSDHPIQASTGPWLS